MFQIFMGAAPYKRVKQSSYRTCGPAGITATPTEPKHLGTRLHPWNHENPAPSHVPPRPSDYAVATNECAASQTRAWPPQIGFCQIVAGSRRALRVPTFRSGAGPVTGARKSGGMRWKPWLSAMSGLPLPSAQPESVSEMQAWCQCKRGVSANYTEAIRH
jgi:hypothetical protein